MGGRAFANHDPPLPTPRMPLAIYNQVLANTITILQEHYEFADSPIEAPGKPDYGDVDFLVASPKTPNFDTAQAPKREVAQSLAQLLNAKAFNVESGNPTINLAVPWPQLSLDEEQKYVQIDIHTCPSANIYRWELFHSAHGDLWNILGSTIRYYGFTINDRGLYLRIPEIELHDRKKSLIFLTDEPREVLDLLGLDEATWWKQFNSQNEMFEYAASCRFFWVKEKDSEDGDDVLEGDVIGDFGAQEGGEAGKKKLKHNDRQRMSKRPIFKSWIDEFIPKCREEGRFGNKTITRESIRDEIFEKYPVKEEYEARLKEWLLVRHRDELWRDVIKGTIPVEDVDPVLRAAAIRELKAVIMEGEPWEGEIQSVSVPDENGFYDLHAVKGFVDANWRKAGDAGVVRSRERMKESQALRKRKKQKVEEVVGEGKGSHETS